MLRLNSCATAEWTNAYIRPVIFRGLNEDKPAFGVNPFPNPIDCYIAAWDWGKYLGEEALEAGVDVCVSSWTRIAFKLPSGGCQSRRELYEFATY